MKFNDRLLKDMYVEYGTPCDRLVSDPLILTRFTEDYIRRSSQIIGVAELGHHMLNLRRLGEDKGGLPRLFRRYFGRDAS